MAPQRQDPDVDILVLGLREAAASGVFFRMGKIVLWNWYLLLAGIGEREKQRG